MAARWLAFVIWAAVAASAVGWGVRLFAPARPAPLHTVTVDAGAALRGDLTRLFGVDAPPPPEAAAPAPADGRFRLVGVAAPRAGTASAEGFALIAVDGKPARAFRVGAVVDGDVVLQEVRPRGAALGPRGGAATVSLEVPPLPPAATGTMPVAPPGGSLPPGAGVSMPMPAAQMPAPLPASPVAVPPQPEATTPQLPQS